MKRILICGDGKSKFFLLRQLSISTAIHESHISNTLCGSYVVGDGGQFLVLFSEWHIQFSAHR